jgi:hypothetical protein
VFSLYSYERIHELWREGNPFAWHLSLESRLLFSSDHSDYLEALRRPQPYTNYVADCQKFVALFREAYRSVLSGMTNRVFKLSTVFLSIRNIATCFSLGGGRQPDFSRYSALRLGADSISISHSVYQTLEKARILCARGYGANIPVREVDMAIMELGEVDKWMIHLLEKAKHEDERVQ